MNLETLSKDAHGHAISIPLVVITGWLVLALQRHQREPHHSFSRSLLRPFHDLWRPLGSLWRPGNVPIQRRPQKAKAVFGTQERSRARGWIHMHQRAPVFQDQDHAYEGSQSRVVTPLADVVKGISENERMNSSAV